MKNLQDLSGSKVSSPTFVGLQIKERKNSLFQNVLI